MGDSRERSGEKVTFIHSLIRSRLDQVQFAERLIVPTIRNPNGNRGLTGPAAVVVVC